VACSTVNFTFIIIIIIIIIIQEFPRSCDNSVMSQGIRLVCSYSTTDKIRFSPTPPFPMMNDGNDDDTAEHTEHYRQRNNRVVYVFIRIPIVQPKRFKVSQFIYFCNTLYMFQMGFCVHHQELKTAHTASGICQNKTAT